MTQGIRDICFGNTNNNSSPIDFLLAHTANSNDVVINEILFNPRTDGDDFVELFNRSEKVIDLSSLRIADEANIPQLITEESFLLFPNSFTVITVDKENILQEYPLSVESRIIEINNLPHQLKIVLGQRVGGDLLCYLNLGS